MAEAAFDKPSEIVIIRRRAADDAAMGKGGAWKIAYADFVTAMMAFFLVMWLINASNEATRAQVASYFNPIKLMDSSTGNRGVVDAKTAAKSGKKQEGDDHPTGKEVEAAAEEGLLADPQKQLDRIANQLVAKPVVDVKVPGTAESTPRDTGAVKPSGMGDPFDPQTWNKIPESAPVPAANIRPQKQLNSHDGGTTEIELAEGELDHTPEKPTVSLPARALEPAPPSTAAAGAVIGSPAMSATGKDKALLGKAASDKAADLEKEVLMMLGRKPEDLAASLEVRAVSKGMLISLVDRHLFGMFKSGSAEPEPQLIELVGAIAKALERHPGKIVIRGHTDAIPYRNKKYDNWQLSTARAHMAQYMLVRGGLDDLRIHRVEGLADRELRMPNNPNAPENRRIDILLETGP